MLVGAVGTDGEILSLVRQEGPQVVAIDAPLSLPRGWHCLEWPCRCGRCDAPPGTRRSAEAALSAQGIGLFWTTRRSIIKPMIYRAIGLRERIALTRTEVIEVYPYASKVRLFGRSIPKKGTVEGRRWLRQRLDGLVPGLAAAGPLGHDELDALVAAYTAYLYGTNRAVQVGDPQEGAIVLPRG